MTDPYEERKRRTARRLKAMYLLHVMGWSNSKIAKAYGVPTYAVRGIIADMEERPKKDMLW